LNEYNIAFLIRIVMKMTAENQFRTGSVLLNAVARHPNVNVNVDDRMISRLMSEKKRTEIHGAIMAGAVRADVTAFAKDWLKENLMQKISRIKIDDLCEKIIKTLRVDSDVSDGFCNAMQMLYADKKYLDFMTDADLYALSKTNLPRESAITAENLFLLQQTKFKCPLNGALLWKKNSKTGQRTYSFQIVKIYPDDLPLDLMISFGDIQPPPQNPDAHDNKIALCKKCAEDYMDDPTEKTYKRLLECKAGIKNRQINDRIAAESDVEDKIVDVIRAISNMDGTSGLMPFNEVLKVSEKIHPEFYLLEERVEDEVVKYYTFVENQFSALDGTGNATFNIIRGEVITCYEKYESEGRPQDEIFEALVTWLLSANGLSDKHRIAANVIVSFFVQNCAVFKPREQNDKNQQKTEDNV